MTDRTVSDSAVTADSSESPTGSSTRSTAESSARSGRTGRRVDLDYLRAAVVVLVVWHHAVLAYVTWGELNRENPIETVSPVVDTTTWVGFDLMVGLNDTFFMPLMFFVSGLFVWSSLRRKGSGRFVRDRFLRLGIPFVVGALLLMPLAYYPAQLTVERTFGGSTGLSTFWSDMAGSGFGTAGPLWFVWVLLVFGAIVAALYAVAGDSLPVDHTWQQSMFTRRSAFFGVMFALAVVTYLPLAIVYDPEDWLGVGLFHVQISRVLFYLGFFLIGVGAGAYGLDRGVLAPGGALTRRWWLWLVAGLLAYVGLIVLVVGEATESLLAAFLFLLTCSFLVVASLAAFLRHATRPTAILDNLAANAYGIYIVHYLFVNWLQYWLLPPELPAVVKAVAVFVGALLLSWFTTAALRRIPVVARII